MISIAKKTIFILIATFSGNHNMIKTAQQSLMDFILDVIPSLKGLQIRVNKDRNNSQARTLLALWDSEENKIADRQYRRPSNMTQDDIRTLISSGYVVEHGSQLKITNKGSQTIKQMILQDQSSSFDKKSSCSSACFIKTASKTEVSENLSTVNWYKQSKM
jgi:hypothetical protein